MFVSRRTGGPRADTKNVFKSVYERLMPGSTTQITLRLLRTMQGPPLPQLSSRSPPPHPPRPRPLPSPPSVRSLFLIHCCAAQSRKSSSSGSASKSAERLRLHAATRSRRLQAPTTCACPWPRTLSCAPQPAPASSQLGKRTRIRRRRRPRWWRRGQRQLTDAGARVLQRGPTWAARACRPSAVKNSRASWDWTELRIFGQALSRIH